MKAEKFIKLQKICCTYVCVILMIVFVFQTNVVFAQTSSKQKAHLTIKTEKQLRDFFEQLASGNTYAEKLVKLGADIDVSSSGAEAWKLYSSSNTFFCGTFDGAGYTISGMNTNSVNSTRDDAGLFGCLSVDAVVKNLTLKNCKFTAKDASIAMIAGYNKGLIDNCHIIDSSIAGSSWTAGIAIRNPGTIQNCTVDAAIEIKAFRGSASGIAHSNNGNIQNCAFTGSFSHISKGWDDPVSAADIALSNATSIKNCFGCGTANFTLENSKHYGITGSNYGYSPVVKDCYYSTEVCDAGYRNEADTMEHVKEYTLKEMQSDAFVKTLNSKKEKLLSWTIKAGQTYPVHVGIHEITFKALSSKIGYVTSSYSYAPKGTQVKLTPKLKKNYKLKKMTVKTISGKTVSLKKAKNGTYTFKMPDEKIVVNVTVTKK